MKHFKTIKNYRLHYYSFQIILFIIIIILFISQIFIEKHFKIIIYVV